MAACSWRRLCEIVTTPVGPKGKFTIKTKAATMGVRGTEFAVLYQTKDASAGVKLPQGQTRNNVINQITVIHGKVEVQDKHAALLAAATREKWDRLGLI